MRVQIPPPAPSVTNSHMDLWLSRIPLSLTVVEEPAKDVPRRCGNEFRQPSTNVGIPAALRSTAEGGYPALARPDRIIGGASIGRDGTFALPRCNRVSMCTCDVHLRG